MPQTILDIVLRTLKEGTGAEDEQTGLQGVIGSLTELQSGYMLAQEAVAAGKQVYDDTIGKTTELASEVRKLNLDIGATPEEASKLIFAANAMGVSTQDLTTALQNNIRKGGQPTIENLQAMADQYNAIQDPIARTKFLEDEFGRSGANMGALMQQGSQGIKAFGDEAQALGLVMSQKDYDAALKFKLMMNELNDTVGGVEVKIGEFLIPRLMKFEEIISDDKWVKGLGAVGVVGAAFWSAVDPMDAAYQSATNLSSANSNLTDSITTLTQAQIIGVGPLSDLDGAEEANIQKEKEAKKAADDLATAQSGLAAAEHGWASGAGSEVVGMLDKAHLSAKNYMEALQAVDAQYGTGFANQQKQKDYLQSIVDDYKKTGNLDELKTGLANAQSYFQPLDDSVDAAKLKILNLQDTIDSMHGKVVEVDVITAMHTSNAMVTGSGGKGGGRAFGTGPEGFIVPPGYPNDSYPVYAQSGEQVIVRTQAEQQSGSGASHLTNYGQITFQLTGGMTIDDVLDLLK